MSKYIDTNRLIHDLEERIYAYSEGYADGDDYRKDAIETLLKDVKYQCSLQQEQPSLPDDLDEAAEKYYFSPACSWEDNEERFINAFKAGAEWAIQQLKVK